jgi:predicted Fe-S protein YdhL (DUF1289 family)
MTEHDKTSRPTTDTTDRAAHEPDAGVSGSCDPVRTVDPAPAVRTHTPASAAGEGVNQAATESLQEPPSPCVSVCALDENDVCMGCYRTASEITDWFLATPAEKHAILRAAGERRRADSPIRLL